MTTSTDPRDGSRSFHLLVNIFPVDESLSNEYNLAARSGGDRYGRRVFERAPAASYRSSAGPVPGGGSSITCSTDPSTRDRKVYPARLPGPLTRIRRCLLRILVGSLARRSGHLTARTVQIPELLVQAGRSGWPWLCARSGEKSTATGRVSRAAVLPASPTAGEAVHGFLLVN